MFLLLVLALFLAAPVMAQRQDVLSSSGPISLRMQERLLLSEVLRVMPQDLRQMEVLSLTLSAQSFARPAQLQILSRGQSVAPPQFIRRDMREIVLPLPPLTELEDIELVASEEMQIQRLSAQVVRKVGRSTHRLEQPAPQSMLTLELNQNIRGMGQIELKRLLAEQQRLTLEGVQIERVIVEAVPGTFGRSASVQLELNGRPEGEEKVLVPTQRRLPLQVFSMEEIHSLKLLVRGDALVRVIRLRVGQVRPIMVRPMAQNIREEISAARPLELSQVLLHENRMIRSITLSARVLRTQEAEVALVSFSGEVLASTIVSQSPMKTVLRLMRPMSIRDLRLESLSPVLIEGLEVEF